MPHLGHYKQTRFELIDLYQDFMSNFHGKTLVIQCKWQQYDNIEVLFDIRGVRHLLAMEKIGNCPDNDVLWSDVVKKDYTLKMAMDDDYYDSSEGRILLYPYLNDWFYSTSGKPSIALSISSIMNMRPKRLGKIEVIIYDSIDKRRNVVLGLIPTNNPNVFAPASLHARLKNDILFKQPRATVTGFYWKQPALTQQNQGGTI